MTPLPALIEQSLSRAADLIGDITPSVIERLYCTFPDVKAAFAMHSRYRPQLEGEMVQEALYCLMTWFESPKEVEIMLNDSVMHHNDTLLVRPEWYAGLIDATAGVIMQTIPSEQDAEYAAWRKLTSELKEIVERSRRYANSAKPPLENADSPRTS